MRGRWELWETKARALRVQRAGAGCWGLDEAAARCHSAAEGKQKLMFASSLSTGLDELKKELSDDRASFAYARVTYANDKESTRDKFVFIVSLQRSSGASSGREG